VRILVVTNRPPLAALTGGGQRTDLLLRALGRHGDVDLLVIGPSGLCSEADLAVLRSRHRVLGFYPWTNKLWAGFWRFPAGWLPGLPGLAAEAFALQTRRYSRDPELAPRVRPIVTAGRYDVAVVRAQEALLRADLLGTGARIVLDVDDVESEVLRQHHTARLSTLPRAVEAALVRRLRAIETSTFAACEHLWLASEEDHQRLALPHSTVLPNVPWVAEERSTTAPRPSSDASQVVLFVGNLAHEPNTDGLDAFVAEAWPRVRRAVPTAVLRLVGPPPPAPFAHAWRGTPGVEMTGFVADLAPVYDAAALTIAPLTWGGGTAIKVLESLAHARPCVLTTRALRGFASFLRHDESVWSAPDVAAMADGCIALLRDGERRRAMGEHGRRAVERHAGVEHFDGEVARTLATA
jgi:glycosyltransferase involved in cell wall biosynthesis